MITIEYTKMGRAISDFEYEQELKYIKKRIENGTSETIRISNSVLVQAIRFAIVKGEVDPEQVQFKYEGKFFQANKYGAIMDWPRGFCDTDLRFSEGILRTAMDMRLKERKSEAKES